MTQYNPVLPPYAHQKRALEKMKNLPAFALLMAMRTGKTKVLIDDWGAKVVSGKLNDLLLIAPGGALYGADALETQVHQHLAEALRPKTRIAVWRSGKEAARRDVKDLLSYTEGPRILLMNVEALSVVEEAKIACGMFLRSGRAMMAIDESTTIKTYNSKRTKVVTQLGPLARERRILTGLVAPQSPLDLFSQFYFLNPNILGFKSWWGFRARHAITKKMLIGGRTIDIIVDYRYVEELKEKIEPYSIRVNLEECYDVPRKVYLFRDVELTDEQTRMYREMKKYATTALSAEHHVTATSVITQILRLHQMICGYVVDENGELHEVKERRTKALLEILEEHEGKAIIWCSYDYNVKKVSEILTKEFGEGSVARFWGGNQKERIDEELRFKNDDKCRFMIATAAAGGRGRDWKNANLVIYYSNSANLEHRDQSEERPQAIGKFDPVTYVDIRTPGTVDDHIIKNLRSKIDIAAALQGDKYREWLI